MISGVVAQELPPLPHGVLRPSRLFVDNEVVITPSLTSGLDKRMFPGLVIDDDPDTGELFFETEAPQTLTPGILFEGDGVFSPLIARDIVLLMPLYTSADIFFTADIRIPGVLQPGLVADSETIFPTPLILDPGMLRQTSTYFDVDFVPSPTLYAAQTFFPPRVNDTETFYAPRVIAGQLSPPFVVADDVIFPFSSQIIFRPPLFIDSARPVLPPTFWDGPNDGVTISSDGLTAALTAPRNYCGARSSVTKNGGKFYWEVAVGPSHGAVDQIGIGRADGTFVQLTQSTILNYALGVFLQFSVIGTSGFSVQGVVIGNGLWYCHFGHSTGVNRGGLVEGDVIGIAVDVDNRQAWFRLNGGHWNNDQLGTNVLLNQDPTTGIGGIPVPNFAVGPILTLGGQAGDGRTGSAGDNLTANFGVKTYRTPAPAGYLNWEQASPLGAPVNGDSFGQPLIGIPAILDGPRTDVSLTNGSLTATHSTTNSFSGAQTASEQRTGRYYWEVTVGATHGGNDSAGLNITTLSSGTGLPKGDFQRMANGGSGTSTCYLIDGSIWSNTANTGKTIGPVVAGDVIGIAVDLTAQSTTQGGLCWFRKRHAGITSNWNGAVLPSDADPATGVGGLAMQGFGWTETWAPAVGFSGNGSSVGDQMTANFGATPVVMPRPTGFSIWPRAFNNSLQVLTANTVLADDSFVVPFIDLANRQLFHPLPPAAADDVIFATRTIGGNLLLLPQAAVASDDAFFSPGYFARFDSSSPQIALSNGNFTATVVTQVAATGARSNAQQIAGKYYVEYTWTGNHSSQDGCGFLMDNATYADMAAGRNSTWFSGNGGIAFTNGGTFFTVGGPVAGDIIGIALDLDVRKVWFRRNGGQWNGNASYDPETNNGGLPVAAQIPLAPAVIFNSPAGNAFTMNLGISGWTYSPPLGFGIWPGNSVALPPLLPGLVTDTETIPGARTNPVYLSAPFLAVDDNIPLISATGGSLTVGPQTVVQDTDTIFSVPLVGFMLATFDGPPINATLSNGNLTATHGNTTTDSGARSTAWKTAGKWYCEVTIAQTSGSFDCVGALLSTGTFNNFVSSSTNCVSTFKSTGNIWGSNAYSGKTLGALTAGDIISVAMDLDARKAWLRKNGGNWNGLALGSENPNTGLGGVAFATGGFAPAVGFGGTGSAAGDAMTLNAGKTGFAFPAPTGFQPWTSKPDLPFTLLAPFLPSDDLIFPWSPALISGLKGWYAADLLSGTDNTTFTTTWPDSSGNGNNSLVGNAPILQVAELNGRNVLQWGSGFAFMALPNLLAGTTGYSVFMVLIATGTGGCPLYIGSDTGTAPQYPDASGNVITDIGSTVTKNIGAPGGLNAWHIAGFRSQSGLWRYYKNGTLAYQIGINTVGANTQPQIGRFSGLSNFFPGMIAEIVIVNDPMNDADWQRTEGFLAHKWGLAGLLPAGHPYKAAPP